MSGEEFAAWKRHYAAVRRTGVTVADIERRLGPKRARAIRAIWSAIEKQPSGVLRAVAFNEVEADFMAMAGRRAVLAAVAPTTARIRRAAMASLAVAWLGLCVNGADAVRRTRRKSRGARP